MTDSTLEERDEEVNSAKYVGLAALATVIGALAAYFLVPESDRLNAPLAACSVVVMVGSYGCYAWLLLMDKSDFVGPTSDWFMTCVMCSLIGGLGVAAFANGIGMQWYGLPIALALIVVMIALALSERKVMVLSKYSYGSQTTTLDEHLRLALSRLSEKSSV